MLLHAFIVSTWVLASPKQASLTEPDKDARALVSAGARAYGEGNFPGALELYYAAYKLDPRPALLFNIGQCNKQLRSFDRALLYFRAYLREDPRTRHRALVNALIADCERELAREPAVAKPLPADTEPLPAAAEPKAPAPAHAPPLRVEPATQPTGGPAPPIAPMPVPETPIYQRWWFWTAIGGLVATSAAVTATAAVLSSAQAPLPTGTLGTIDRR